MAREVTHLQIDGAWIDCSVREQHSMSAQVTSYAVEDGSEISDHVRAMPDTLSLEGIVTNQPIENPGSHMWTVDAVDAPFDLENEPNPRLRYAGKTVEQGTTSIDIDGPPTLGWLNVLPGASQAEDVLKRIGEAAGIQTLPRKRYTMIVPVDEQQTLDVRGIGLRVTTVRAADASQENLTPEDHDRCHLVYLSLRESVLRRAPIQVVTALRTYENCVITDLQVRRDAQASGGALYFTAQCTVIRLVKSETSLPGSPTPKKHRAKPHVSAGNQNPNVVQLGEITITAQAKAHDIQQDVDPYFVPT